MRYLFPSTIREHNKMLKDTFNMGW
jgi:hypothetical protein